MKVAAKTKPTLFRHGMASLVMASLVRAASMPISTLRHIVRRLGETDCDGADVRDDPLSHPALQAMSSRELADLPFSAGYGKWPGR